MKENDIKISKMVHRGLGLGHKNGRTYMIYNTLPDEVVDAEIIMTKKSYSIGRAIKIKERSPFRVEPVCKYYQICGGCQYMHAQYQFQIELKQNVLYELLSRSLKRETIEIKRTPSILDLNYRLRAQFIVRGAKVGFTGFGSNDFVRIDECKICHGKINEAVEILNRNISTVELNRLFVATDGERIKTYPIKDFRENLEIMVNNLKYVIKPEIFFQANIYTLSELQRAVMPLEKGISAVDFYAGSGFFSLYMAKFFEYLLCIEEVSEASNLLKRNASINKIENIEIINSSVENAEIPKKYNSIDLLLLDPPRSGMSKRAIGRALNLNPKNIFYVSCDPATLARDISYFHKNFYEISEIIMIDQFPHTFHFETVVKMRRQYL
ncbi:MAG: class I SAM-dependent RNA methyltransferase [Myxococcota bacterium]